MNRSKYALVGAAALAFGLAACVEEPVVDQDETVEAGGPIDGTEDKPNAE